MKKIYSLLLLICLCFNAFAAPADGDVKGVIIDARTNENLEFVNVVIKKKGSDKMLKGTVSDSNGKFYIDNLAAGEYIINISFIGYTTIEKSFTISSASKDFNIGKILLSEDAVAIDAVKVVGQQSNMKFEIDKKVFNVDADISSKGGTASEILTNIPSVEVDNEGEISLRGSSSVTVWINGKASGLTADNRAQILEQMPAENIEKIEVITNPSAKFSPEGTAGIINIVLKKNVRAGYYGSVQAGVDSKGGYNASANINYNSTKIDAYASLGYRRRKRDNGGLTNRTYDNGTYLNQTSDGNGHGNNMFARAGLTFHATTKDHFSIGGFGMFGNNRSTTTTDYLSNVANMYTSSTRFARNKSRMRGGNVELGYKHEFAENHTIDFTASYNTWNNLTKSTYTQNSTYAGGNKSNSYQYQENHIKPQSWDFQLDYVNAFTETSKLEAGYKGTLSRQNSPVETWSGTSEATAVEDQNLYNRFIYNQDIHALYATYSGRVGKLGYQGGLRGEYSNIKTRSLGYGQTESSVAPYKNNYFSLFPSAFLSYQINETNELQLNYTRRISRPWGGQLNSFMNITDSTNISFGNPKLKPQYSNSFELNYLKTWKGHTLSFSAYYRTTDNIVQRISFLEGSIMKSTYENIAKSTSAGAEIVGKDKFFKWLDVTTTVNLYYYKLDGFSYLPAGATTPVIGKGQNNFSWNVRMIANVSLPWAISMQLTGDYNSRQVIAQGYQRAGYRLDAGIRKTFNKISVSLSARDVFDSRKRRNVTNGSGYTQYAENWRGGRRINLTLTYSFGNMKAKRPERRDDERQQENSYDMGGGED